ncbi:MAG: insulinase family protein [Lentisphaeria bacterium]|jgi:hypothetical protein
MSTSPNGSAFPVIPAAGEAAGGFTVTRVTPLPALRATVVEARHDRTGARLLHVATDDSENLCAIGFRTPPADDTGVPHILEHSVLGGSRKFPVKDPFLEMLKRSMATFINAFTYSDKTVYPVCSTVPKDFFNLVDVYLDAVFHPTITPATLKQEGHHLALAEPADPASPLVIKGIVYNEMKGAYSELDALIDRVSTQMLFPDTPYGRDSGGDPAAIPALTYGQFRAFHDRYYHPANSFIVLYGNIPTGRSLEFIGERLAELPPPPAGLDSRIPRQPRWEAPREHLEPYPIGPDDDPAGQAAVTIAWLVGDAAAVETELAFEVIDQLLLGHDGAPLHKALIDSRLGEDLTAAGFSLGTLESSFHVGLKGTDPEKKEAILQLVLATLEQTVRDGFPPERVEAAFQQLEYSQREISNAYPLRVMNRVYEGWLYDLDPLTYLRLDEALEQLRQRWRREPDLFTRLIEERLVRNPHRLTAVFLPEPQLQRQRDAAFAATMAARKAAMPAAELALVVAEAAELARRQDAPNSPEALATLPVLHKGDLPRQPKEIPAEVQEIRPGLPLVRTGVFANGVNYFVLASDLTGLPADLWDVLPAFTELFNRLGTKRHSFVEVGERITACTGGLGAAAFTSVYAAAPERILPCFSVSFKALDRRYADALAIVRELLLELDFADSERLRDLANQMKVQRLSGIIDSGHYFSLLQAAQGLSPLAALNCRLTGLPQVRFAGRLAKNFDAEIAGLREKLGRLQRFLLDAGRFRAAFTGGDAAAAATASWLAEFASALPATPLPPPATEIVPLPAGLPPAVGLAHPAEVAFVAAALPAPTAAEPAFPALQVFSKMLALGHLWEEIRAKGGAYGGLCSYDPSAGTFGLMSYRDPNIRRTLAVYDNLPAVVREMPLGDAEVERGIISVAKAEEAPIRPGAATATALWRQLSGLTPELRRERYERLLAVTGAGIRQAALEMLERGAARRRICVLAGKPMLDAANAQPGLPLAIETVADEG